MCPSVQLSLNEVRARIVAACERSGRDPQTVTLIGASKTVEAERLGEFFHAGLHYFGENYIQEGIAKVRAFEEKGLDAHWHLIGALQSNKAREAVRYFEVIHSVDRLSLAKELDKEARKIGKRQRVLVQVNLGSEASKAGVLPEALASLLQAMQRMEYLQVEGLMSLPPYRENPQEMRPFHWQLQQLALQTEGGNGHLSQLSMGMSNDFEVAIEEGATLVRVGTALFGARG